MTSPKHSKDTNKGSKKNPVGPRKVKKQPAMPKSWRSMKKKSK